MSHRSGGRLAGIWLMLAALAWLASAPAIAQEPVTEELLIERLRQIQGALPAGVAEPAQDEAPPGQEPQTGRDQGPTLREDEVRSLVSEGLGVDVLNVEAVDREGRSAYAVTVMSPPGNTNGAFAVETLLIDGASGELLGRVPQTPRVAAPGVAGAAGPGGPDRSGIEIRRRTYR